MQAVFAYALAFTMSAFVHTVAGLSPTGFPWWPAALVTAAAIGAMPIVAACLVSCGPDAFPRRVRRLEWVADGYAAGALVVFLPQVIPEARDARAAEVMVMAMAAYVPAARGVSALASFGAKRLFRVPPPAGKSEPGWMVSGDVLKVLHLIVLITAPIAVASHLLVETRPSIPPSVTAIGIGAAYAIAMVILVALHRSRGDARPEQEERDHSAAEWLWQSTFWTVILATTYAGLRVIHTSFSPLVFWAVTIVPFALAGAQWLGEWEKASS